MMQNILPGVIGAIVGAIVLTFLLGIPGEVNRLGKDVSKLQGQVDTLIALQGKVDKLETRVESVEDEVSILKGKSKRHGSGWADLDQPVDLSAGDKIELFIGGSAERIVVRLLPDGQSPDQPIGVLSGNFAIPDNRLLTIELMEDHPGVVQISVHGGPNPWGKFPLGSHNGPATLEWFDLK